MPRLAASVIALLLIAAVPAVAAEEPPARVGRVSFVAGQLGFHIAGETQWSAAAVNYPVATGGAFWTDPQSRAEIRIGSQTISLDNNTELDVTRLDQQVIQLSVPQGRIGLHLRQLGEGNSVEVDIPRGGVWLLGAGIYDIDAGSGDQPSRIMVFEGSARFVGGAVDTGVKAGEAAVISGTDPLSATLEKATTDAFVQWCRSRDYRPQRLAAPYYVSPRMTGYEELDENGTWLNTPNYGQVWAPSGVPSGWAPYREGHWLWLEPWGWTWIDAEPWGFAPFHYGRWLVLDGRWVWIPGRFVEQPVYAPALCAFIGDPGVGIAIPGAPGPAVGWFPLGPDEVYWPSYWRDPAYIRSINITNVSEPRIVNVINYVQARPAAAGPPPAVINQSFANRSAATVVPVSTFASAARVAPAAVNVPAQQLQQMPVSMRPPQVTPSAASPAARPSGAPSAAAPATGPAPAGHPPGAPTTATTTAPTGHPPGAPTAATTTAPTGHPPGAPTAATTTAPTGHPPGAPTTATTTAPAGHPPGAPTAATTTAPTGHPPGAPTTATTTAPAGHPPPPTAAAPSAAGGRPPSPPSAAAPLSPSGAPAAAAHGPRAPAAPPAPPTHTAPARVTPPPATAPPPERSAPATMRVPPPGMPVPPPAAQQPHFAAPQPPPPQPHFAAPQPPPQQPHFAAPQPAAPPPQAVHAPPPAPHPAAPPPAAMPHPAAPAAAPAGAPPHPAAAAPAPAPPQKAPPQKGAPPHPGQQEEKK